MQPRSSINSSSLKSSREEHRRDAEGRQWSAADDSAREEEGEGRDERADCHEAEFAVLVEVLLGRGWMLWLWVVWGHWGGLGGMSCRCT